MANPSTNYGFRYMGVLDGVTPNFGMFTVSLGASNSNVVVGGDVAGVISSGIFAKASASGGGAAVGGVFLPHFEWYSISAGKKVIDRAWRGATADILTGVVTAKIVCHPHARFMVRTKGSLSRALTLSDGPNINFYNGATAGANSISTSGADDADMGAGASLPFRIIEIVQQPESDPGSTYNELIVMFNNLTNP